MRNRLSIFLMMIPDTLDSIYMYLQLLKSSTTSRVEQKDLPCGMNASTLQTTQ